MSKDPYQYEDVSVLKNKLGIKDKEELERAESTLTRVKLANSDEVTGEFDFEHLMNLHLHIFGDLYDWAGKPREIDLEKPEHVLGGLSVQYSYHKNIERDVEKVLDEMEEVNWSKLSKEKKSETLSKNIAKLWQVHPFREGNTRTVMTFAVQFAVSKGIILDKEAFANHSKYVRNSLVLASIGEYSEYEHLNKITFGAIIDKSLEERLRNAREKKEENEKAAFMQCEENKEKSAYAKVSRDGYEF